MFPALWILLYNFCFLLFPHRTSIEKWKKIWCCYVHKWTGKKEMSAKISKWLCQSLFIWAATQIRAVYKDHKVLVTFKNCITLPFLLFYDCHTDKSVFCLFDDSANKTKAFNLKVNCKKLRLAIANHWQKDTLQNKLWPQINIE